MGRTIDKCISYIGCGFVCLETTSFFKIYFGSSDSAIKEFIKYVDEKHLLGRSFILFDLDDVCLFVSAEVAVPLQASGNFLSSLLSFSLKCSFWTNLG